MTVPAGRTLRYDKAGKKGRYRVVAVGQGGAVDLGEVERTLVSTDSMIAGTRLRRPGKGRVAWLARAPVEEAIAVGGDHGPREVVFYAWGVCGPVLRVEWRGRTYEKRSDAAGALVFWHDNPDLREGPA